MRCLVFYEGERPRQFETEAEARAEVERAAEIAPDCEARLVPLAAAYHAKQLLAGLRRLVDDMRDAGEDRNPETGQEYDSVTEARAALDAVGGFET